MPDATPIARAPAANSTSPTSSVRFRPAGTVRNCDAYTRQIMLILHGVATVPVLRTPLAAHCTTSSTHVFSDRRVGMGFLTYAVAEHAA
jgi:hypothetical protein